MPLVSQAQRRWAYWTASGKNPDTPPAVGKEFLGHGVTDLPAHAPKRFRVKRVKRRKS